MNSIQSDQKQLFPWANLNNLDLTLPGGIAAGITIYKTEQSYLKFTGSSKFFQNTDPQEIEKKLCNFKNKDFLLKFKLIILFPIFEEIVFRGLFRQNQIDANIVDCEKEALPLKVQRIFVNSGIFAAIHCDFRHSLISKIRIIPPIFFSGVIFNGLMEITENIAAPILGHSISNLLSYKKITRKIT
ncbi:CPBP family intramembrane glutamic endopeptidase [Candidatus Neptunichlamydia sp. REUL1]|uniref:CPBP family intramembrane glutamic endopeptidase n=1 Tax=Candidatus Neptunichlamydia sp. REUL1 TaxID=3064277 RepID=UPI00292FF5DD|nr:CPBP family intramembrane glutamic endopeptidase [Candidatus Neptunochlamydia sp. REUL1]